MSSCPGTQCLLTGTKLLSISLEWYSTLYFVSTILKFVVSSKKSKLVLNIRRCKQLCQTWEVIPEVQSCPVLCSQSLKIVTIQCCDHCSPTQYLQHFTGRKIFKKSKANSLLVTSSGVCRILKTKKTKNRVCVLAASYCSSNSVVPQCSTCSLFYGISTKNIVCEFLLLLLFRS